MNQEENDLTQQSYWDDYWQNFPLPAEIKKSNRQLYINEILKVFDVHMPKERGLSILEIGGSPGRNLVYMHRNFGYDIHSLDYSKTGCDKTQENFALLNVPGTVHQADLFSEQLALPKFDIVYSLGVIEHFNDLESVIDHHLKLLKPNGTLLIGTPNFLGINHFFLRFMMPELLSQHNLNTMDIRNWHGFEERFGLQTLFKGYVGGFEPSLLCKYEKRTVTNIILKLITKTLRVLTGKGRYFTPLRKINSRLISCQALGVYRKP
jgi:2-polyprenyl-3-methyl-5-hydroxy-6-metoxy-1,4-benzoquinol methylase